MAATNYTPIQLYFSTTASAVPLAANLAQGELAINITDGKLYYEDNAGVVQVIATKGAGTIGGSTTQIQYNNAGALAGSAAMVFNNSTNVVTLTTLNLTNALGATYGGTAQSSYTQGDLLYSSATNTLSKLGIGTVDYILTSTGSVPQWSAPSSISVLTATNLAGGAAGSVPYQSGVATTTFLAIGAANRVMTSSGTAPQWVTSLTGLTGVSSSSITNTSLTSGRVVVSTAGGAQADDADLTFDGTTLSAGGYSTAGLTTLVKTVKIGDSNFSGVAVFAAATPAKLYIGTGTVTDTTSAIGATNAVGAISSLAITPIAATNTSVTYTNAATLYIAGAPSAGTNVTITNPYSLYIAAGDSYFGGNVVYAGGLTLNGNVTVGDSSADTLTINSTITSNLIFTDNTYDIGASGATRPRNLYLAGLLTMGGSLTVGGTGIITGNLAVGSAVSIYSSRLTVAYNPTTTNGPIIVDNRTFGINRGGAQWFGGQYNTAGDYRPYSGIIGAKENSTDGNSAGFLAFYVNKNAADAVEAGRFTSTGNLVLGYTASYGGMLTVSPVTGNPTTASSTLNQIQIGEASNNSAYRLNLGYTFVGGGYRGNIQSIVGGAAGTLAINADGGYVGIGTNTPGYVLDVQSSNAAAINTIARFYNGYATGNTDIYVNNASTGGDLLLTRRNGGDFWVYQSGNFPISLYTSSTKRFSVDGLGRAAFGIGGPTADRYIDAACGGITLDAGSNQFGLVLNPTYANNVTATIFNMYVGPNLTAGTTVNNVYNLYLEAINSTGSTVNVGKWGLYQAGSADSNYFAGPTTLNNAVNTYSTFLNGNAVNYPEYAQNFSVGTTQWIRLCGLGNPGTMKIRYFLGSGNSEEFGEVTINATYTAAQEQITVTRQSYNSHLQEVRLVSSAGQPNVVYFLIRSDTLAPRIAWTAFDVRSNNGLTIYNDTTTPGAATSSLVLETGSGTDSKIIATNGLFGAYGGGVQFPSTQVASSNANTLDDYEEGTWTPAISGITSVAYTQQYGNYIKIGKQVTCFARLLVSSGTGSGAAVNVTGLPFTAASASNSGNGGGAMGYKQLTLLAIYPHVADSSSTVEFYLTESSAPTAFTLAGAVSGYHIFYVTYLV